MPYRLSTFQLPCGARCARIDWVKGITAEDAQALMPEIAPGGKLHGVPLLSVSTRISSIAPEARAAFTSERRDAYRERVALVTTNPMLRVIANFVIRIRRDHQHRMFKTEEEAIQWLDEEARKDAKRGQGAT